MFRLTYTARLTRITKLRDLYPRAVKALERRIEQNVVPRVVQLLPMISAYPGQALYPFKFATENSRRYYFWKYGGRIPYARTETLMNDWAVIANGQLGGGTFDVLSALVRSRRTEGMLTIDVFNAAPEATYVYGPHQAPGHFNTGWGEALRANAQEFINSMAQFVVEEWRGAVEEGIDS